jgi:hypothetical protein
LIAVEALWLSDLRRSRNDDRGSRRGEDVACGWAITASRAASAGKVEPTTSVEN